MPHICPVLADVGFNGCSPTTLYQQQILKSVPIYTLHSQGLRFVESHICQNRADMGHPGFVADRAVRSVFAFPASLPSQVPPKPQLSRGNPGKTRELQFSPPGP